MDDLKIEVAKTLAVAQSSQQFRDFMLRQARLEIPGEPTLVWMMVCDSVVHSDGSTFAKWMAEASLNTPTTRDSLFYRDTLLQLIPNLCFTFFVDYEEDEQEIHDWEFNAPVLVAPATSQFQSAEGYSVASYNNSLNITYLDNQDDPTEAVIVVEDHPYVVPIDIVTKIPMDGRPLETVLSQGVGRGGDICEDLMDVITDILNQITAIYDSQYSEPAEPVEPGGIIIFDHGPGSEYVLLLLEAISLSNLYTELCLTQAPSGGDPTGSCDRDSREKKEQVVKAQFYYKDDVKSFCPWNRNFCSIEFTSINFIQDAQGDAVVDETIAGFQKRMDFRRKDLKRLKVTPADGAESGKTELHPWEYLSGKHADVMYYKLIGTHPDAGLTQSWSMSFGHSVGFKGTDNAPGTTASTQNATISRSYTFSDQDLYNFRVDYCDDANGDGTMYNSSVVKVWMKEAE